MSVEITGLPELLNELDRRLGSARMQEIMDIALKAGAEVFVRELKSQFERFADTGASLSEITVSEPMTEAGVRKIKVHWRGPRGRYRIIHLNEFGTVKNPNPRGKGAIARAMRAAEREYRDAVRREIERGMGG
ncbi:HK97-gp10 family putative phage morphogenesis protein [Virgibacillus kimchii]